MDLTLAAETGRNTGSRPSGRLRGTGRVPGVVYGLGQDPEQVSVEYADLRRVLTTEDGLNALIKLQFDSQDALTIVKDLQRDPVRREIVHVDFLRVDPDAEVLVDVPIMLLGEAKEVENMRGIVEQQLKALPVWAKPGSIPRQLEADISALQVGDAITVADLDLPSGSRTDLDPESPVVSGVSTRFSVLAQHGMSGAEIEAAMAAEEAGEAAPSDAGSESGGAPEAPAGADAAE